MAYAPLYPYPPSLARQTGSIQRKHWIFISCCPSLPHIPQPLTLPKHVVPQTSSTLSLIAFLLFSTYHISLLSPTHFKQIPLAHCCILFFTSIARIATTEPVHFKLMWVLLVNIPNPQNWPF